jgi:hypothetical protein
MANAATVKVKLLPFNGEGGAAQALAFIRNVTNMQMAGNLNGPRTAAAVAEGMTGAALNWYNRLVLQGVQEVGDWPTFVTLIRARFVRPMTVAQIAALHAGLAQKPGEMVQDFRDRVELACLAEDVTLPQAEKEEDGYITSFNRRVKRLFLTQMRNNLRMAMIGVDPEAVDIDELERLAKNAETLIGVGRTMAENVSIGELGRGYVGDQTPADLATRPEGLSVDAAACVDEFRQRMTNYGYPNYIPRGGGAGRGQPANRGGGRGRGGGPADGSKKATCGRCGLFCRHTTQQCYVNLEELQRKGKGKFARGGARGGGRGGHADAAGASTSQEDPSKAEAQAYADAAFGTYKALNG